MPIRRSFSASTKSSARSQHEEGPLSSSPSSSSFVSLPPSLVALSQHLKASAELLDQQEDHARAKYDPKHPLSRIQLALAGASHALFLNHTVEKETRDLRVMYREFLRLRTLSTKEMRSYILNMAVGIHLVQSNARGEHLQSKCLEIFFLVFLPAFIPFFVTIVLPIFLLVSPVVLVMMCLNSLRRQANNIWEQHARLQETHKESLLLQQWQELRATALDSARWTKASLEVAFEGSQQLQEMVLLTQDDTTISEDHTNNHQGTTTTTTPSSSWMSRRKKGFSARSFTLVGSSQSNPTTTTTTKRRKNFFPRRTSWSWGSAKASTTSPVLYDSQSQGTVDTSASTEPSTSFTIR